MQAGKSASAAAMETAANLAASAKSGLGKTMAVVEEKMEKMTKSDPIEKDMATMKKADKIKWAELEKQEAYAQNAAASAGGAESYTASGDPTGYPTGYEYSHGSTGHVTEDVIGSHYPIGTAVGVVGSQDPPGANTDTGRTPVYQPPGGTDVSVDGAQYPVGANTETGRSPVQDPKSSHGAVGTNP